jgi:hypothetical protein
LGGVTLIRDVSIAVFVGVLRVVAGDRRISLVAELVLQLAQFGDLGLLEIFGRQGLMLPGERENGAPDAQR